MLRSGRFGLILLAIASSLFFATFLDKNDAHACSPSRSWCNSDEQRAYNTCHWETSKYSEGAIWFNNSGSSADANGYYKLGVSIAHNAEFVPVTIRGSVYSCITSTHSANYGVYVNSGSPNASRLTVHGSVLYRGTMTGAYRWSTQGGSVSATLDTRGLAPSTTTTEGRQTINIGVYRCFSSNGTSATGSCATSSVPVVITRAKIPMTYNLTPSVTVPSAIEAGGSALVTGVVAKTGNQPSTSPTDVRYTRIIYKAGQSAPRMTAGTGTGTACEFYTMTGSNASRCTQIGSAMGSTFNNRVFTNSSNSMNSMTDTVPDDFNPGDRICYGLSVRGYNETTGPSKTGARHSALRCVTVGKKPKVHVIGSDLYAGRAGTSSTVSTSISASGRVDVEVPQSIIDQEVRNTQRYWYFGKGAAMDFYPSQGAAPKNLPKTGVMTGDEGSTVATNREGEVQFYTDGMTVYNPSGTVMTNGTGLAAKATTTQAAAVFPISNNRYVIVTSSAATEDNALGSLRYSVVNMTSKSVIVKNRPLGPQAASDRVGEALSVVPRGEEGYWVVTNKPGTVTIRAFYIPYTWAAGTNDGASIAPVDSNPGDGMVSGKASGSLAPGFGTINFYTPDGGRTYTKMVITMRRETGTGSIRVLNFNANNGRFTGQFAWNISGTSVYSGDFSPDGNYVYATSLYNSGMNGYLHRYKLSGATTSAQVANSRQDIVAGSSTVLRGCGTNGGGGQVKSAPDGKMYVANKDCSRIGVINTPGASTVAGIGWQPTGHTLASGVYSSFGLPQTAAVLPTSVEPPTYARTVYGSWSEYGITASGQVSRMGSAAGYAGGIHQEGTSFSGINLCSVSLLTFSNQSNADVCVESGVGHYVLPASVRSVIDRYATQPGTNPGTSFAPSSLASGVYKPTGTGVITLQAGTMAAGRSVIIYAPNNDVVINGSLMYTTGAISGIRQVPQLVIIARNITINEGVTQVDAWLVAKTAGQGNIYTCNYAFTSLTTSRCSARLTVNGPVISNKIHLRRTAGAGAGTDGPRAAEVFNLRPDAYFWGVSQSTETGRIPTVMTKELPPRF